MAVESGIALEPSDESKIHLKKILIKAHYASQRIGLHLVIGGLVFAGMTVLLGAISEDVVHQDPVTITDAELSNWLHVNSSPLVTKTMWAITSLGATVPVTIITVCFVIYLLSRRRYFWLVAVLSSVIGGVLLNRLLKFAFHRPRPYFDDPILTLTSYSFPSGHTMVATVLYGVMAAYFIAKTKSWLCRVLITLVASLLIMLVGFSRIYLGAHYLTDVLGAMAEGLAWLTLCLTIIYSIWLKVRVSRALQHEQKNAG